MSTVLRVELSPEEKALVEKIKKEIELVKKTGKLKYGFRNVLRNIQRGTAKAVVIASNIPPHMKAQILYLSALANVPVIRFPGNARELGEVCGRPHIVSSLVIIETGTSNITKLGSIPQL